MAVHHFDRTLLGLGGVHFRIVDEEEEHLGISNAFNDARDNKEEAPEKSENFNTEAGDKVSAEVVAFKAIDDFFDFWVFPFSGNFEENFGKSVG